MGGVLYGLAEHLATGPTDKGNCNNDKSDWHRCILDDDGGHILASLHEANVKTHQ